jgi:hypothetical protein
MTDQEPIQYECFACGERFVPKDENNKQWTDSGDFVDVLVCDKCLADGWHVWRMA